MTNPTEETFYTPTHNGLEDFGEAVFGPSRGRPVYVDGVRVVGPTTEPALVAEYFRCGGVITHGPTVWAEGALRFSPGWDSGFSPRIEPDSLYD